MEMRRSVAVASAALLTQAGCASSTYQPRPDGRIATVLEDGRQVLVKDGKTYPYSADGLLQAVTGNAAAEEHARSYASDTYIALAEQLIGIGALITGAIVAAPKEDANGNSIPVSSERQTTGAILGIAGLVIVIVSAVQVGSAQGHFMDAVNIYNDGVAPRLPPGFQPRSPVPLPPPAATLPPPPAPVAPAATPPAPPPPVPPARPVTPAPAYPPYPTY